MTYHRSQFMSMSLSLSLSALCGVLLLISTSLLSSPSLAYGSPSSHPSAGTIPTKYQCKEDTSKPLDLLPSKGVRVLVTGAAGFIGSHVARIS
jgi:hypothetical protein